MIYVIVLLPALWLVAWYCMDKCCCAATSLMSHLSSVCCLALLLSNHEVSFPHSIFAQMIMKAGQSSHLFLTAPGPKQLSCLFTGDAEALTLPYACLRMDEETEEPRRR